MTALVLGLAQLLAAWAMATVIARRCFLVVHNMDIAQRQCSVLCFYLFGLSYSLLMVGALWAAGHVSSGTADAVDWLLLTSSSGMILFDRRPPREKVPA